MTDGKRKQDLYIWVGIYIYGVRDLYIWVNGIYIYGVRDLYIWGQLFITRFRP